MPSTSSNKKRTSTNRLAYSALEPRQVLNGDFGFLSDGTLLINDLADSDVGVADEQLTITQFGDTYLFSLSEGAWTGTAPTGVFGGGTDTLRVDINSITGLILESTQEQYDVLFQEFDFDGDVEITTRGLNEFGTIADGSGLRSGLQITGDFVAAGVEDVTFTSALNDFNTVTFTNVENATIVDSNDIELLNNNTDTLSVNAAGDIIGTGIQTIAIAASLEANGDILLLDSNNDFGGTLEIVGQQAVEIVDRNDLIATNVVGDSIFLRAGVLEPGSLTLELVAATQGSQGSGQVLLQASNGFNTTSSTTLLGNQLLVGGDDIVERGGSFDLTDSANVEFGVIAANIEGSFNLGVTRSFTTIDSATFDFSSGGNESFDGITSGGNVVLNAQTISVGSVAANVVSLNADQIFDTGFNDGQVVAASNLILNAVNGAQLDTAIDTLTAKVSGSGDLIVNEEDEIELTSVFISNGRTRVLAGDEIVAQNLVSSTQFPNNDVRLISEADIVVERLIAGGQGDVFLISDDDVYSTDTAEDIFARRLVVRAGNDTTRGPVNGINLRTNVQSTDLVLGTVGGNAGDIVIEEDNFLVLTNAISFSGAISVSAGGNLTANSAFSRDTDEQSFIELTTTGIGSDVVVGRVATFQRLGGVTINAADDIRIANQSDAEFVRTDDFVATALNNQGLDNFNGILLTTAVKNLTADVAGFTGATDGISIQNTGFLTVQNLFVENGSIQLENTNGNLIVENAVIGSGSLNSRVSFSTRGDRSDIILTSVSAQGAGGVFLESADDIFDSSFADSLFIDTPFVSAAALNRTRTDVSGILISTNAVQISADAFGDAAVFIRP